jgi:hypothetical protein
MCDAVPGPPHAGSTPDGTWTGATRATLGEVLAGRRRRRFVGRTDLLELFRAALEARPAAFAVLHVHGPGDALCAFNPVYGQGITVAALEALTLRRHLVRGVEPRWPVLLCDLARAARGAWDMAVGADLAFPGVPGRRTLQTLVLNRYVARLQAGAVHDPALARVFVQVSGLVERPQALLRPAVVLRVLRPAPPTEKKEPRDTPTALTRTDAGSTPGRAGRPDDQRRGA